MLETIISALILTKVTTITTLLPPNGRGLGRSSARGGLWSCSRYLHWPSTSGHGHWQSGISINRRELPQQPQIPPISSGLIALIFGALSFQFLETKVQILPGHIFS